MIKHIKEWAQKDTPLIWIEMIFVGDTYKMKEYMGFSYGGHLFISRDQNTTFYKNLDSYKKAKKYGKKKYSDRSFIGYYIKKTKELEEKLIKQIKFIKNTDLPKISNKELFFIFKDFFHLYSTLAGFYRFSRPDFYESLVKDNKKLISLEAIGHRRLQMHNTWLKAFNDNEIIFEEIGKRMGFEGLFVKNCTFKEMKAALLDNDIPDKDEIRQRVRYFEFIYNNNSILDKILRKKISFDIITLGTNDVIVTGQCAQPGKVIGKIRVIEESLSGAMTNKMKDGEVILTNMTSPDMMPAIHKASAIVTDEGGILSHAAIIARELKIPCVIGTKIATKVLKDGDFVEVDANKGIVKKLK